MTATLPSPTDPVPSTSEVFLGYLDYFRASVDDKVRSLDDDAARSSRLPTGWTPVELVKHLAAMERRWLVWGMEGERVDDPWRDTRDDRWHVAPDETVSGLLAELHAGGERTREIVGRHRLSDVGAPGERWDGAPPATLERVLFHVLQEYARHAGHLDVVTELAGGTVGE